MIRNFIRGIYRAALPVVYAHSEFKLFLRATLGHLDLRLQSLVAATDYFSAYVRPIPIKAPFGKSALILAPHQDDETIGCGGALALQVHSGNRATIVVLQDGAGEHQDLGMSREALVALRNAESVRAAAVVGLESPVFLNYTRLLDSVPEAAEALRRLIVERHVDCIFTPFLLDAHDDHRTANYILACALKNIPSKIRVLGYEVWGLAIPNVLVIIDQVMDEKLAMLRCFTFANQAIDYTHSTKGLNMYRSRLLGAGECQYAECFFELPREEFVTLAERIYSTEHPTVSPG